MFWIFTIKFFLSKNLNIWDENSLQKIFFAVENPIKKTKQQKKTKIKLNAPSLTIVDFVDVVLQRMPQVLKASRGRVQCVPVMSVARGPALLDADHGRKA